MLVVDRMDKLSRMLMVLHSKDTNFVVPQAVRKIDKEFCELHEFSRMFPRLSGIENG